MMGVPGAGAWARSGKCRGMGWREVEPDCGMWSVPAEGVHLDPAGLRPVLGFAAGEKAGQSRVLG